MEYFASYSYIGIFVFLLLTGCGLPLPEEVGIIYAGIQSGSNELYWWLAFPVCLVGAVTGDLIMYGAGRRFGRRLLRKNSRMASILSPKVEQRAEKMIKDHGLKVFFVARFLPGVRAPMYVTAGILRVPVPRFLFVDAISAVVVVGTVFGLSYYFGRIVEQWVRNSQATVAVILATVVVVLGGLGFWEWRRRRKADFEDEEGNKEAARALGEAVAAEKKAAEHAHEQAPA